jgi:MFS family permease
MGLVFAVTLVAFEALAIATILPVVSRHLGGLRLYGWVFSAFMLTSLIGIVVAGTLADRVPLGRPMVVGLALFAAGLVVGGTAPSMPVLVAGRAVQGLGAGFVPAIAYVAISRGYPERVQPRMFAILSTAWVVPGLIGPAIAALVATAVGWRWVFLGLVPLVVVSGAMAAAAMKHVPPPAQRRNATVPYVPVLGVVSGAGLALASISSGYLPAAVVGAIGGGALLVISLRKLTPPGTLTARRGLPATVLSRGLLTCAFFAADVYVPYAITTIRHSPTGLAALALTAGTLSWTGCSWVQARTIARLGPRRLVRSGECLVIAGVGLMSVVLIPSVPPELGVLAWSIAAAGMGLAYAPLSLTTLDRAAPGAEGKATSALQLCDVLGQAIGTGLAGAIVAVAAINLGHRSAVGLAFFFGMAVGLVALFVGARVPERLLRSKTTDEPATASPSAHDLEYRIVPD